MNRQEVPNAVVGFPGRPRNGGSRPRFYHFDDDVTRLVKWHPSPHGQKACYNELVASRLGQLIGAPILRGTVVFVSDDIIPDDHRPDGAVAGFHFASTAMDGDNFLPATHYGEIENTSQLPAAAVQLAWLNVGDQMGHNQYLQRREPRMFGTSRATRFMLIDMGFMFGSPTWNLGSVQHPHASYQLPPHIVDKLTSAKIAPVVSALKAISDGAIRECFTARPAEWAISDEEAAAATTYALRARDGIEQIIRAGNPGIK